MAEEEDTVHHTRASRGLGLREGLARIAGIERPTPAVLDSLRRQNKVGGFMGVSYAWGKPAHLHVAEFCENGAKSTFWERATRRCTPEFFAEYTVLSRDEPADAALVA